MPPRSGRLFPLFTFFLGLLMAGAAAALAAAIRHSGRVTFFDQDPAPHQEQATQETWTCPMHPFVVSDRPGACPICHMDLVLRTDLSGLDRAELTRLGRVSISPVERVLANVATVPVGRADLSREIRAFGQLVYDETSYATIPAWVSGRIDTLHLQETGTTVERGQRLLSIYSPDLLAAQEEYLVILRSGGLSERLAQSAERRLQLLGMSRRQIRRLAERAETTDTVTVYAPAGGTIVQRLVQEGDYVQEGQPLFFLAGTQNYWVEAEVFEKDAGLIQEGSQAEVWLASFSDQSYRGILTLVWPALTPDTRTLRVRVELESIDPRFRAGMFATVMLTAPLVQQALVVPVDAVIRTGQRNTVYVEVEPGLFERRVVELGHRALDLFEIRSGLSEEEQVVARGGFLIDSEAQLYTGGQSLHFHHLAEQQGIPSEHRPTEQGTQPTTSDDSFLQDPPPSPFTSDLPLDDPLATIPNGHFFCPTNPAEHRPDPGRCSDNNIPMMVREEHTPYNPDADPITYVPPGQWYCPMGAEWVADQPGRCPICGMNLVRKEPPQPSIGQTSASQQEDPLHDHPH
ncbi:MAG: efflux RND transporter periplasmic adaptor subunit [Bradymonadales bacterium]|nr:efflux RND transporter periplasmic adaptor subunit [Bradymonadales bacterium]